MRTFHDVTRGNREAWDIAAGKYAARLELETEFLRGGGVSFDPIERAVLGDLSWCTQAVHLQCSHGLDALSLLQLGAHHVVGVDFSAAMLELAATRSLALSASASWIEADVLDLPAHLADSADLVYSGKGALPWVQDLDRWAAAVAALLRPGGRFVLFEGHPLNWVWRAGACSHSLRKDGRGYFDTALRENADFPASAVARLSQPGTPSPRALERQWTLGRVVTAISDVGLRIELLKELPRHYWPQFPEIPDAEMSLLPHSYILAARASA